MNSDLPSFTLLVNYGNSMPHKLPSSEHRKDKRRPERIRTSYIQVKFIIKPNIKIIEIREIIF